MAARRISAANGRTEADERRRKCMGGSWGVEDRSGPKHNRPPSGAVAIATTRIASVIAKLVLGPPPGVESASAAREFVFSLATQDLGMEATMTTRAATLNGNETRIDSEALAQLRMTIR